MSQDPSATPVALTQRPLAANATYTQSGRSRIALGTAPATEVRGIVYADQAGTLYVEESNDGAAWTQTATVAVAAGALADTGWVTLSKRDYRFRYVNGAAAQTSFSLFQAADAGVTLTRSTLTGSNVTDAKTLGTGDVGGANMLYNGATWDRQRNNTEGTLLASAARTATTVSSIQTNYNAKGIVVFLDVTVASGIGGLAVRIVGRDPATGNLRQLHTDPTAIVAIGPNIYILYPGASTVGGQTKATYSSLLPRQFAVQVAHTDASSYTYSIGYALII